MTRPQPMNPYRDVDWTEVVLYGDFGAIIGGLVAAGLGEGLIATYDFLDYLDELKLPEGLLLPHWTEDRGWDYGAARGERLRWFDPRGGEWRWNAPDEWHDTSHWDYNAWDTWNSEWEKLYPSYE